MSDLIERGKDMNFKIIQSVLALVIFVPLTGASPASVIHDGDSRPDVGPAWQDRILEQVLYAGSDLFTLLGLPESAQLMRHYLDGSGETLQIDIGVMLRDMPEWRADVERATSRLLADIAQRYGDAPGDPRSRCFTTAWLGAYSSRTNSPDWFFALGAFSYQVSADVHRAEYSQRLVVKVQVHVRDRYDWDRGRGTWVAGLYIPNEIIGWLQQVGLARDFKVVGDSQPVQYILPLYALK
jgi:hypothetical protein